MTTETPAETPAAPPSSPTAAEDVPPPPPPPPQPGDATTTTTTTTTAPVTRKKKRKKKSTPESSLRKQQQMEENEKMVAWKLASRQRGYFQPRSFDRLPKKGTDAWQQIWSTRTDMLDAEWTKACKQVKIAKQYRRVKTAELDAYAKKECTPERALVIAALLQDPQYKDVKTRQRASLQALYLQHKQTQTERLNTLWTKALEDTDTTEHLREMPTEKTKEFKAWLKDPGHRDAYATASQRHKELLSINPL
jgi:hypothetical protein